MTQAIDINTDPSCNSIMDPDTTLGSNLYPDDILALGGMVTQVKILLEAIWPLDNTKASDCHPKPGPVCDVWLQCRTCTSAQAPASIGSWTLIWFSAVAGSGCH